MTLWVLYPFIKMVNFVAPHACCTHTINIHKCPCIVGILVILLLGKEALREVHCLRSPQGVAQRAVRPEFSHSDPVPFTCLPEVPSPPGRLLAPQPQALFPDPWLGLMGVGTHLHPHIASWSSGHFLLESSSRALGVPHSLVAGDIRMMGLIPWARLRVGFRSVVLMRELRAPAQPFHVDLNPSLHLPSQGWSGALQMSLLPSLYPIGRWSRRRQAQRSPSLWPTLLWRQQL